MLRMRSPEPDRRGRFVEKDVPSRLVQRFKDRNWTEVREKEPEEKKGQSANVFDVSGNWFSVRSSVRDVLGADELPASKDEAVEWLKSAGYEVTGE